MKSRPFTIADYLLVRLKEIGVDHMFGVVGDFCLGLFQHVARSKVKLICCCNELNGAYAADGYARVHGVGAIASTYVVGELSAMNGIAGAFAEHIPVVKITGCPAVKHYAAQTPLHHTLGDYTIPYQMYQKITCASTLLLDPDTALAEIDRVLAACIFHRRPVYIGIPADIVATPCRKPQGKLKIAGRPASDPAKLREALDEACSLLEKAKKPVILADFELDRHGLQKPLRSLLKKTGYPFATLMLGKTIVEESHPQYLGLYAGNRSRSEVRKRVEGADAILALGVKITDFNSGGFSLKIRPEKSVLANIDAVAIRHHVYENVNLGDFIDGLARRLRRRSASSLGFRKAYDGPDRRRALAYDPKRKHAITVSRLFDRMGTYLNKDCIMVVETGSALFAGAELVMPEGSRFMSQTFYGSIGYTVGATLGMAVGAPKKRVVLFVGDGSFQLTAQEVSTMIRYGLDPIIFLINNDGYLVERDIGDGSFNDLQRWNYAELPGAFGGGWGVVVSTEEELERALEKAWQNRGRVSFIEVIDDKWDSPKSMIKAGAAMAKTNFIDS